MGGSSMKTEFYQDAKKKWRWRVIAENHKIVGASSEGFENLADCEENLRILIILATTEAHPCVKRDHSLVWKAALGWAFVGLLVGAALGGLFRF